MNRLCIFLLLVSVGIVLLAPLEQGNLLVVKTAKMPTIPLTRATTASGDVSCTSDGSLFEISKDGEILQELRVPAECQFFYNPYVGHLTLSTDGFSAVLPCCIDPTVTSQTVGFVEIYNNGTMSPMQTLQLLDNSTEVINMVKHGSELWFGTNFPYFWRQSFPRLYYANLTSSTAVNLLEKDVNFVEIPENRLLVSNYGALQGGIMQVGTDLPRNQDPVLSAVLNREITVNGFIKTDRYAYIAQSSPDRALIRCDPNTWEPLYRFNLTSDLIHITVLYDNDTDIEIVGNLLDSSNYPWNYSLGVFHDNGTEITVTFVQYDEDFYIKAGSLTPITHCMNNETDFDETDVDCGGSLCDTCQVGKKCSSNSDCASNYCSSSSTCADKETPPTSSSPTDAASDASTIKEASLLAGAALLFSLLQ